MISLLYKGDKTMTDREILEQLLAKVNKLDSLEAKLDKVSEKQESLEIELLRFKADTKQDLKDLKHDMRQVKDSTETICELLKMNEITDISKKVLMQ